MLWVVGMKLCTTPCSTFDLLFRVFRVFYHLSYWPEVSKALEINSAKEARQYLMWNILRNLIQSLSRESNHCPWDFPCCFLFRTTHKFNSTQEWLIWPAPLLLLFLYPCQMIKRGIVVWRVCMLWVVIIHKPLKLGAKTCSKLYGWLLEKAFRCTQLISGWMFRSVSLQDVWAPLIIWRRKS